MKNTPNYNLPQYEGTDKFTKEVLNDAFSKIDLAIDDLQETFNVNGTGSAITTQEVVNARNGKQNLKERIDEIESNLNNVVVKTSMFVTPSMFKLQSDIDDTNSLQKAINYCIENNATLKADKDTYLISKTLQIKELINIEFNNVIIKATSRLEAIFKINVTIRPNGVHVLGKEYGLISNITFDCNNLTDNCIYIVEGRKYLFEKIKIYNLDKTGFRIDAGYEVICKDFDIVGTSSNAIGFDIRTSDCHFEDIILTDVKKGIINAGTNFYSRVHGWILNKEYLANNINTPTQNSIFFELRGGGTPILNSCYSDTYCISFYITSHTRILINGLNVFYSPYVWTDDMNTYTPYLFYYEKLQSDTSSYQPKDFSRQTIMSSCNVRGVSQTKNINMSNLPNGSSYIRCDNDSNELVYVSGVENNCISGLNIKPPFVFNVNSCYNVVNRKNNRVSCKLKLYSDTALTPNTEYTVALFTDRYVPSIEFITQVGVSSDGWSSNFSSCYCYVSPQYGIKIKTPNDSVNTRKYVVIDIVFDMNYWV